MRLHGDWRRSLLWLGIVLVMLAWAPGAWAQTDIPASVLTTASLTKGQARSGTIDQAGDSDWYKLILREANAYQITVTGPAEIRIYDYAGALKASSGTKQYYVWGAPLTGTYFIAAQGKGTRTGAYTIKVSVYDHAAGPSSEGKLTVGKTTTGRMTNSGPVEFFGTELFPADEDWLAFQFKTPGCYLVEAWMDSVSDWLELSLYEGSVLSYTFPRRQCFDINSDGSRIGCTGSRGILLQIWAPQRYHLGLVNQPVNRTAGGKWHASVTRRLDLEFRYPDSADVFCSSISD
jgi:hypothetical protein